MSREEEQGEEEEMNNFEYAKSIYENVDEETRQKIDDLTINYVCWGQRIGLDPCQHIATSMDECLFSWMFPNDDPDEDLWNLQMNFCVEMLKITGRDVYDEINMGKSKGFAEFSRHCISFDDHKEIYHQRRREEFVNASMGKFPKFTGETLVDNEIEAQHKDLFGMADEFLTLVNKGDLTRPRDDERAQEIIETMNKRQKL